MAKDFVFRRPGVYVKETDINYVAPLTRQDMKDILMTDPILLNEVVYELRQEKLKKIKNEIEKR